MNEVFPKEVDALTRVLQTLAGGHFLIDAAKKMKEAVKCTTIDGVKTGLTISFEFKKGDDGVIIVQGESRVRIPTVKPKTLFFVSDDHLLTREPPKQALMFNDRNI